MKTLLAALAAVAAVLLMGNSPAEAHGRHVPAHVCAHAWHHPASRVVNRCQRQGWEIEVDYDGYDKLWQVLVISPRGRVVVDNFGAVETR